jgi:hypothetical protein
MKTAFLSTLILALSTIRKFLSSVPGQGFIQFRW